MTITPLFTDAGLAALTSASNAGLKAKITHLAFGDTGWSPTSGATSLDHERFRAPVDTYQNPGGGSLHLVSVLGDDAPVFTIREVAAILEDGTVLAIWSDPNVPASAKIASTNLTFTFALSVTGLPESSLNVTVVDGSGLDVLNHLIRISNVQMEILSRQVSYDRERGEDQTRMTGLESDLAAISIPADLNTRLTALETGLANITLPPDHSADVTNLQSQIDSWNLPENASQLISGLEEWKNSLGTAAYRNVGIAEGDVPERLPGGGLVGEGKDNARPLFGEFWGYREGDFLRIYRPSIDGTQNIRLVKAPPPPPTYIDDFDGGFTG